MNWIELFASNPFYEFAAILLLAAVLGTLGLLLRQPLIVMFIAVGILAGPSVLNLVQSKENIKLLAEIGISILLFIVGLKLDVRIIRSVGKIALLTGLGQVLFTSLVGYVIGIALGFDALSSFYIAVALTFSSTIIIVKLLTDKKEIDSLHGQIAIGFLIVQDIVVILVMIVLSALQLDGERSLGADLLKTFASGGFLLLLTYISMRWIIPRLSFFLARSQEILTLSAIAWALTLAVIGELIHFSAEVGAFLAGVSLASSAYKEVISSRLVSLRDFLLLFFFVNLGANLNLGIIGSQVTASLIFSIFVLVGNPLIVLAIMGVMGYRKRTSFLAGLTVAQISEFSLIFAGLGLTLGHIQEETLGLITLVGLITIGLSTYLILYSHQIYEWISPALSIFERKTPSRESSIQDAAHNTYDLILIGAGRFGRNILDVLAQHPQVQCLCVDFDPTVVKQLMQKGWHVSYGDIEDPELLQQIPFQTASCIISTVPDRSLSMHLIKTLRQHGYNKTLLVTALQEQDAELLKKEGADNVLMPYQMAAGNFYSQYLQEYLMLGGQKPVVH